MGKHVTTAILACIALCSLLYCTLSFRHTSSNAAPSSETPRPKQAKSLTKNALVSEPPQNEFPTEDPLRAIEELAKTDFQAALEKAKTLTGEERSTGILVVLSMALSTDPEYVAREVLRADLPEMQRGMIISQLDMAWPDPERGLEWIATNLTGSQQQQSRARLFGRLAEYAPEKALEHMSEIPPGTGYDNTYYQLMLAWSKRDPVAALEYAKDKPNFTSILSAISPAWIERDPASVKAYLIEHQKDSHAFGLARDLAENMAEEDPNSTLQFAAGLSGKSGTTFQTVLMKQLVQLDPESVAAAIKNFDIDARRALAPILSAEWSSIDIVSAKKWMDQFPENEQVAIMGPLLWNWIHIDPDAASEWTNGLNDSLLKEKAVSYYGEMERFLNRTKGKHTSEVLQIIKNEMDNCDLTGIKTLPPSKGCMIQDE